MSKKTALVFTGKNGYQVLPVDPDIMTKELIDGRICYVLDDVKTFPNVDISKTFGRLTAEKTYVRFTFECSARVDLRSLVRYAVGCDRFGNLPLQFKSHSGKLTITTCLCGTLAGASKFMLRAMNNDNFTLQRVKVDFVDAMNLRQTQTVTWSRKDCEKFEKNTDITHKVQTLRKAYSLSKL